MYKCCSYEFKIGMNKKTAVRKERIFINGKTGTIYDFKNIYIIHA